MGWLVTSECAFGLLTISFCLRTHRDIQAHHPQKAKNSQCTSPAVCNKAAINAPCLVRSQRTYWPASEARSQAESSLQVQGVTVWHRLNTLRGKKINTGAIVATTTTRIVFDSSNADQAGGIHRPWISSPDFTFSFCKMSSWAWCGAPSSSEEPQQNLLCSCYYPPADGEQ